MQKANSDQIDWQLENWARHLALNAGKFYDPDKVVPLISGYTMAQAHRMHELINTMPVAERRAIIFDYLENGTQTVGAGFYLRRAKQWLRNALAATQTPSGGKG